MTFKRGEKWGRNRPIGEILMSTELDEYLTINPPFNINIQQVSKTPILMDCMLPGEGRKFVQLDFSALEQIVIAELSKSKTYIELFASGKPHDPYLFAAIAMLPSGPEIDKVYQRANVTKESVAAAKKQFKRDRTVGKLFSLMSAYKAGHVKIRRSLLLNDVEITLEEAKKLRAKYWGPDLFGDVLEWEEALLVEVKDRGGYLLNGFGFPFAVNEKKEKDVMNIMCQSSGHMALELWLRFVWKEIEARGLWEHCYAAVDDFHDETVLSVEDAHVEAVADCLRVGMVKLNAWLAKEGAEIPFSGTVEIASNFTEFKGPDAVKWYSEKIEAERLQVEKEAAEKAERELQRQREAEEYERAVGAGEIPEPKVRGRKKRMIIEVTEEIEDELAAES